MDALASLAEKLPEGAVSTHPGELSSRSRDWWALAMLRERRGERPTPPLAVVFPQSTDDVATVLSWAVTNRIPVVPRGGGSGVCGGAQAVRRGIILDLSRMEKVLAIDDYSLTVEVEAGIRGDRLERQLDARGLTLGHYPQSLAISSVGGWIAAGSAGQASAGYGAIEDMVLGLTAVLPGGGVLRLRPTPRSAAGPDLRQLLVGSEGTLGVVTEVMLSVSRQPKGYRWAAYRPGSFEDGIALGRAMVQRDLHPLVERLYDDADAALSFGAVNHPGGCVLLLGFADGTPGIDAVMDAARDEASFHGADPLGDEYGPHWWAHRNDAVETYRKIMGEERVMGRGVIADTMEVAALWGRLPRLYSTVRDALLEHASAVGCHLSHPYRSGGSLYFTFLVRADDDREAERVYLACWDNAARACHASGATVSHHHGVGLLKAPYMMEELGEEGVDALRAIKRALDPHGVLNPGKLLPEPAGEEAPPDEAPGAEADQGDEAAPDDVLETPETEQTPVVDG